MEGQRRDVLAPIAQRRRLDREHVDAVVEVVAEVRVRPPSPSNPCWSRRSGGSRRSACGCRPRRGIRAPGSPAAVSPGSRAGYCRSRRETACRPRRPRTCPSCSDDCAGERPLTWPKSSLSSRFSLTARCSSPRTNGLSLRRLLWWMARAISSLPVPLSPVISTVALVVAHCAINRYTCCIRGHAPIMLSSRYLELRASLRFDVLLPQWNGARARGSRRA